MTVAAKPAMSTPLGIVRRAFLTSPPTNDVISKPENAKHIADQRLRVPSASAPTGGTRLAGLNEVADPNQTNATAPAPMSRPAGIHVPALPMFCSHLPTLSPITLMPMQSQSPTRTYSTE